MPSVQYYNQTAPFWDFIASMEEQGATHPFFAGTNNAATRGEESDNDPQQPNPWTGGWAGFPFGPHPHRARHGPPHHHSSSHNGPPPPPPAPAPVPAPAPAGFNPEEGPFTSQDQSPPSEESHDRSGPHQRYGHGGGPPHHDAGGPRGGRSGGRGRCGGWGDRGRGGPFGGRGHPAFAGGPMSGFGGLAELFQSQLFGDDSAAHNNKEGKDTDQDFTPDVDVFDTTDSFVVHVSLPGAKKEDIDVAWDADKSELRISGVVHRPGDEELLKALALNERKVGAFERKVRLGSRAKPAQVEVDAIGAKMEDGVLRIEVPKLDSGYVEIKKVDIE